MELVVNVVLGRCDVFAVRQAFAAFRNTTDAEFAHHRANKLWYSPAGRECRLVRLRVTESGALLPLRRRSQMLEFPVQGLDRSKIGSNTGNRLTGTDLGEDHGPVPR